MEQTPLHSNAPAERVLLYVVAIQTGLRSGKLCSLTRRRLFLDVVRRPQTTPPFGPSCVNDAPLLPEVVCRRDLRDHPRNL